jgi:gamma-glutamylcyclotransferase (GGCT)/AIG2-like uncharacterized protein YtfP
LLPVSAASRVTTWGVVPPAESPRATSFSAYLGGRPIVLGLLARQINLDVWENLRPCLKRSSRSRCHHLFKTFHAGPGRLDRDSAARQHYRAVMERVHRLATYGSLAPGRPNAHQLQSLNGRWISGHVHGTLVEAGWGAALGYPALVLAPTDPAIELHVFESIELPLHWARLDDFEGPEYERLPVTVHTAEGDLEAFLYAHRSTCA